MVPSRNEGCEKDGSLGGDGPEDSRQVLGSESSGPSSSSGGSGDGFDDRLRDVIRGESDGDLQLDPNQGDSAVLQWLRALDLQVIGGCRADERLKPLLKLNVSSGAAEDRFIEQLSQHFEVAEIAMLARFLYIPLVSIRVGRINKLGNLLCPTAIRGHLKLTILPSSNLCISFSGDDGFAERLSEINNNYECPEVVIEEIASDSSRRSFLVKHPGHRVFYFWCSEKSKDHGMGLLAKMKDLLNRRPSLSNLTGISESRLSSFAKNLHAYLLGSLNRGEAKLAASATESLNFELHDSDSCSMPMDSKFLQIRLPASNTGKVHPVHQATLEPRISTFKDRTLRTPSSLRSGSREKHNQHGENHLSSLIVNSQPVTSVSVPTALSSSEHEDDSLRDSICCNSAFGLPLLSCLSSSSPSYPLAVHDSLPEVTMENSPFKPYYCWCPPCPSFPRSDVTMSPLPSSIPESLSIPPMSSLLIRVEPAVSVFDSEIPSLDLPALLRDPLLHLSLPVSSFVLPGSQQIPTFTPFMSDPIVHIPVIDVCSSGQAFLVNAGPTISSAIPPFLPGLAKPLFPETESMAEKNARETLKWLMASAPTTNQELMSALPAVFDGVNESLHFPDVDKVDFSRSRAFGVDAIASGVFPVDLYSLEKNFVHGDENSWVDNQEEHVGNDDGDHIPTHNTFEEHQLG